MISVAGFRSRSISLDVPIAETVEPLMASASTSTGESCPVQIFPLVRMRSMDGLLMVGNGAPEEKPVERQPEKDQSNSIKRVARTVRNCSHSDECRGKDEQYGDPRISGHAVRS